MQLDIRLVEAIDCSITCTVDILKSFEIIVNSVNHTKVKKNKKIPSLASNPIVEKLKVVNATI